MIEKDCPRYSTPRSGALRDSLEDTIAIVVPRLLQGVVASRLARQGLVYDQVKDQPDKLAAYCVAKEEIVNRLERGASLVGASPQLQTWFPDQLFGSAQSLTSSESQALQAALRTYDGRQVVLLALQVTLPTLRSESVVAPESLPKEAPKTPTPSAIVIEDEEFFVDLTRKRGPKN